MRSVCAIDSCNKQVDLRHNAIRIVDCVDFEKDYWIFASEQE